MQIKERDRKKRQK